MTKEQAIEWTKQFLAEIDTQDRRATGYPVLFLLQRKQKYVAHEEYNHQCETIYYHHTFEGKDYPTRELAAQALKEYGYEGKDLEKNIEEIEEFQMGHHWETENVFFTEKGVKRHYEINGHNLRRDHRDYVIHAFRNPEMRELFDVLRTIVRDESTTKDEGREG